MDDPRQRPKILRPLDHFLLAAAAVPGIFGTLRSFGTDGVTFPAAALLTVAALLALGPLARLLKTGKFPEEYRKTIIAVIFSTHIVATLFFFPPEDLVNSRPVLTLDHAIHFYQAERAKEVFWKSFRFHTYDPCFMAGYPGGTIFDIDTKGVELWCSILRVIDTARSYKLFIILAHLLLVFSIYSGCRLLKYKFEEAVYALLVFLVYWHWGRPYAGDFRFAGMFAFIFVSHICFYLTGLFRRFLHEKPSKRFYILGPLAFFIHPTAAVILPIPFLALFFSERRLSLPGKTPRGHNKRLLARLVAWCLLVIAVNLIWLVPFFRYLDIKTPSESYFQISGFGGLIKLLIKPGNLPALFLIALSGLGAVHLIRQKRFTEAAAPAAGSLFLLFLAGAGIYLPLFDQMEPGRFLLSAFFFMAPLSGAGLAALFRWSGKIFGPSRLLQQAQTAAVIILLFCSPAFGLISSREYYKHTLSTTFTPETDSLIKALIQHTDTSGRLMIEDGPAWLYGNCHLASIIPLSTGVEQIGGPYLHVFIKHDFSSFRIFRTMGEPLGKMKHERLLDYMKQYNVRWVLTATPESRAYFEEHPLEGPIWSSRHFTLWAVSHASAPWEGRGVTVTADYDRIDVTVKPVPGRPRLEKILLPYHWDRRLKVTPPARISGKMYLDDPVPFILLEPNGETDIRITFH